MVIFLVANRWPDILQMKVKDKNLAIETASEEILFKMVREYVFTCNR